MNLSSSPWDRLAYHRLLPLAESVAALQDMTVEALVLGRGFRAVLGRVILLRAMVRRAGWQEEAARELLGPAAPGCVPPAGRRPRDQVAMQFERVTPAEARRRRSAAALSTAEAMHESAWECSERWAA
jgi:hypothetical protein